jgi:uncharacterized protein (DUF885 family)
VRRESRCTTLLAFGVALAAAAATPHSTSQSETLETLISRYVERRADGMSDLSADAIERRIASDKELLAQIQRIDPHALAAEQQVDWRLLVGQLEGSIFEQETLRPWEKNPELYLPFNAVVSAMTDSSADSEARGRNVAARLINAVSVMQQGPRNLKAPPRQFTEAAIFQAKQWQTFLAADVGAFADRSAGSRQDVLAAQSKASAALARFSSFLEDDLLPRSSGNFAIGRPAYETLLARRWLMTDDAESILAKGKKAFADAERLAEAVANRISPGKPWRDVYEQLKNDHPPADRIKAVYQQQMDAARAFLIARHVVTLPAGESVVTVDTPPAMRRSSPFGTFSSVGPFDKGLQGRLVLTPIEEHLTPEQRRERLRSHHRAWIPIIAVHEAYPGHHVQALKANENPRILRKLVRESIFSEGWGLFCEELMYEQGFLEGDDVRLTQLRNRLWRAARVIIDVGIHTGSLSFEDGVRFLVDQVRFEPYAAELEVGMYTRRPTMVLGYIIGMMEIQDMRDAYVRKFGAPAQPKDLYDRLLRVGALPPSLVRAELLGESPLAGPQR